MQAVHIHYRLQVNGIRNMHQCFTAGISDFGINVYVDCPKRNRTSFLKHLLISLQLNKTFLLQSSPLQCLYTAFDVVSSSGTRFAG
jgi:hypothetical protein